MDTILVELHQVYELLIKNRMADADDSKRARDIIDSISAKFEMICHCVAYINECSVKHNKQPVLKTRSFAIDSKDITIQYQTGEFNQDNLKSMFYSLINLSASLMDSIEELIFEAYQDEIKPIFEKHYQGKKLDRKTFSLDRLVKCFGRHTRLDAAISKFIDGNSDFGKV